ncbi:MAG: DUF63 family protein [Candidatus Hodarchaeales archaeon]|jgi:uncharacterized membrane protein
MVLTQNPVEDIIIPILNDLSFLLTDPIGFFDTYFFSAPGYNFYNTVVYMSVGILLIFLIGKLIVRLNLKGSQRWGEDNFIPIQMDKEFFIAILPFILIGSSFRALNDVVEAGKIISPYEFFGDRVFVTPGVYLVTILLTIFVGIFSIILSQEYLKSSKKFSNWRNTFFTIGLIIEAIIFIPFIPLLLEDQSYLIGGLVIILCTIIFGLIFSFSSDKFSERFFPNVPINHQEKLAMIGQMYDAFNTVIAIEFFGYVEKHYLPAIIFQTPIGSWPFLIVKFALVLFFMWAVRGLENKNLENWLLWVVFLLGLATGTRDFLRLITKT